MTKTSKPRAAEERAELCGAWVSLKRMDHIPTSPWASIIRKRGGTPDAEQAEFTSAEQDAVLAMNTATAQTLKTIKRETGKRRTVAPIVSAPSRDAALRVLLALQSGLSVSSETYAAFEELVIAALTHPSEYAKASRRRKGRPKSQDSGVEAAHWVDMAIREEALGQNKLSLKRDRNREQVQWTRGKASDGLPPSTVYEQAAAEWTVDRRPTTAGAMRRKHERVSKAARKTKAD